MKNLSFLFLFFIIGLAAQAQSFKLFGKITNNKQEPLAFVNVIIKDAGTGTTTKEDGSYTLNLEVGRYNLEVSIIGYKTQLLNIALTTNLEQNLVLEEEDKPTLEDIVIRI